MAQEKICQKKICMLGAFGVGKSSLVSTYLKGVYSDSYKTTVGARIEIKPMIVASNPFHLVIWDIAGEDEFQLTNSNYLLGSAGYVLIADVTRSDTFKKAIEIQQRAASILGNVPFVLALNKFDLTDEWDIDREVVDHLIKHQWSIIETSAKTGMGVNKVFQILAQQIWETTNGPFSLTRS